MHCWGRMLRTIATFMQHLSAFGAASTTGRRRSCGLSTRTRLHTLRANVADTVAFDALILATGATDRVMPIPGWTLPGVFTLGGAQVLLKEHGCLIGRRIVFCGSSPLLYLAAKQYRAMGAEIAAVLDTTPFAAKVGAAPDLLAAPQTLRARAWICECPPARRRADSLRRQARVLRGERRRRTRPLP